MALKIFLGFCGVFLLTLVFSASASADLYYWTDDKGKVHINNDINDVPAQYRDSVKALESSKPTGTRPAESKPPATSEPVAGRDSGVELYDGYDARWWRTEYDDLRRKVKLTMEELANKKQFVELFERGRRMGQLYEKTEVDTYLKYKDELPLLEERIKSGEAEVEDFKRKARYYGVPKESVGD